MNTKRIFLPLGALALAATTWAALRQEGTPGPGEHHGVLAHWEGTWSAEFSMPHMEGATFQGQETNSLMGGMWLLSHFEAEFGGMPFEGHSTLGWSEPDEAYVSTWVDNTASRMTVHKGQWNAEKNQLEMSGPGWDMMGNEVEQSSVTRFVGEDRMEVQMFEGGEPSLKIDYTRKAE